MVLDLDSGAVVFVGDGKGADALKPFWKRLRPSGAKIEAVAMDMSAAYRGAVSAHLPEAVIVFDHFHVIKLFNDKLSDLRRSLYHRAEADQKKVLKGTRWLLLKNPENLDAEQGREAAAGGGAGAEQAAGDGLLPEGGPAAVLGAAGQAVRDGVPQRLAAAGGGVRGARCSSRWPRRWRRTAAGCWRTTTR